MRLHKDKSVIKKDIKTKIKDEKIYKQIADLQTEIKNDFNFYNIQLNNIEYNNPKPKLNIKSENKMLVGPSSLYYYEIICNGTPRKIMLLGDEHFRNDNDLKQKTKCTNYECTNYAINLTTTIQHIIDILNNMIDLIYTKDAKYKGMYINNSYFKSENTKIYNKVGNMLNTIFKVDDGFNKCLTHHQL